MNWPCSRQCYHHHGRWIGRFLRRFGQLFKAGGNNCFAQIAHIVRQFLWRCQNHSFFLWNHYWATFIDIWPLFTCHTVTLATTIPTFQNFALASLRVNLVCWGRLKNWGCRFRVEARNTFSKILNDPFSFSCVMGFEGHNSSPPATATTTHSSSPCYNTFLEEI